MEAFHTRFSHCPAKLVFERLKKEYVIARQCAHCRGNPLHNTDQPETMGDRHTSDISHWFAMAFIIYSLFSSGSVLPGSWGCSGLANIFDKLSAK